MLRKPQRQHFSKKILITVFLLTSSILVSLAQGNVNDEIARLSKNGQYEKIITDFGSKRAKYSAHSLYSIGFAYFSQLDDVNCLKFMNKTIAKNASFTKAYLVKGMSLNFLERHEEAVDAFLTGMKQIGRNVNYLTGLAAAYYGSNQLDLALDTYLEILKYDQFDAKVYYHIAIIYNDKKEPAKALESFYIAKLKVSKETNFYTNTLFYIGSLEYSLGHYLKAEAAYDELIKIAPKRYHDYSTLIQIYYYLKEYEKANTLIKALYAAHENEELSGNLNESFCLDQFYSDDRLIQAFEEYENHTTDGHKKYYFNIIDVNDQKETQMKIVDYSFPPNDMYPTCDFEWSKNNSDYTYRVSFDEGLNYEQIKIAVSNITKRKIPPISITKH